MKKVLVINGANLNMLGIREPELYGKSDYKALKKYIEEEAAFLGLTVEVALGVFDGIIINAGGYTHTSVVILDALKAVALPTVEVHLTDIYSRDEFRRFSYISLYAEKTVAGFGFEGYKRALEYLKEKI